MRSRFGVFFPLFRAELYGFRARACSVEPYPTGSKRESHCFNFYRIPLATILTCIFLTALPAVAQLDMNHDTGVKPEETYDNANEAVNIAGGNLNVVIPLAHLPGRNGHGFTLSLTYNSQQWTPSASYQQSSQNADLLYISWQNEQPWQINIPVLHLYGVSVFSGIPGDNSSYNQQECWQDFAVVMGDGSRYAFPNAKADCWQTTTYSSGNNGSYYETNPFQEIERLIDTDGTVDNSNGGAPVSSALPHALLDLTNFTNNVATLRLPDGSQVIFNLPNIGTMENQSGPVQVMASALVDPNGNVTTISENGNITTISDGSNNTLTLNGGPIPQSVQYTNSSGQLQTILINNQQQVSTSVPTPQFTAPAMGG